MAKKTIMYPFNAETGDLIEYAFHEYPDDHRGTVRWSENYVFEDDMEYVGYTRGCSAARLQFKSLKDGRRYDMFLTDFDDAMRRCQFSKNRLIGKFTFCKRGQNYGVRLLPTEEGDT